jgi:hypothetical protein
MEAINDCTVQMPQKPEDCDTIVWVCGDFRFFNGLIEKFLRELKISNYFMQANPGGLLRLYTSRDALDSIMEYCKYVNIKKVVIITHCSIQGMDVKATCRYEPFVYGMASISNLFLRAKKNLLFSGVESIWYHAEIQEDTCTFIRMG